MFVMPFLQAAHRPAFHPLAALRRAEAAAALARAVDRSSHTDPLAAEVRSPALDVEETPTHYLLSFELPGASKESLRVSVEGRRVRLDTIVPEATTTHGQPDIQPPATADASPPSQAGDVASNPRSLYRERGGTRYARTVSLPQEVDSVASQARFDNGVLSLQLAKRRPDGAHTLTIG